MKCDACGNENYLLLTRQNPKGEKGIFHCEKCTGSNVKTREDAILEALLGVTTKELKENLGNQNETDPIS